jgi:hypothetical protein
MQSPANETTKIAIADNATRFEPLPFLIATHFLMLE